VTRWRAVVAALEEHEGIRSRVSVYRHPLGGRPILWHVVRAVLDTTPPPREVVVVHGPSVPVPLDAGAGAPVSYVGAERGAEAAALRVALAPKGLTLLVDGAAPLVTPFTLARVLRAGEQGIAAARPERPLPGDASVAVAGDGPALAAAPDPHSPASAAVIHAQEPQELLRVVDRRTLDAAGVALRDRVVRQHEGNGVSFLLPATTWVDVDVRIGPDTVVYPGCVIEGSTDIAPECVIGPYSRLVDALVGRGAELRGWNYVVRTHVRNRAVLEPYSRRGSE
jgi:bifunctional N-acetylglucosamine-1-phosphate-uridyltransferase/glucosamine-1-phosphate-acetyltransferase GlmU-like protein